MFSVVYDNQIAVASVFDDIPDDWVVVDCRPLIDGAGNSDLLIKSILKTGLDTLSAGQKVCFSCDYGHSRSNLLAALTICKSKGIPLTDAIACIKDRHPESSIKSSILKDYEKPVKTNKTLKFAITGANGLIGKQLSQKLRTTGQEIIELSRSTHGNYLDKHDHMEQIVQSHEITDIIHLAYPKPYNSYASSKVSFSQLLSLLEGCISTDSRLHYISSWVVFDGLTEASANESTSPRPHSLYAQSKTLQEQSIFFQGDNNGLKYVIYRLPGIYNLDSLEPRFLQYIADCVISKQDVVVHDFTNGSAVVPLSTLMNVVTHLTNKLIEVDHSSPNSILHLSQSTSNLSVRYIAERVAERHHLGVKLTPVSRTVFNGSFTSLSIPRSSSVMHSDNSTYDLLDFIEELINVKQSK